MSLSPSLAVVIIGRNEGARLTRCLDSLVPLHDRYESLEIIYVDSDSTDDSVARARRAGARVILLPPGATTAAQGRNAGWRATEAEFVMFLDGDTLLDPHFVKSALESFKDRHVAVVWGHRREVAPQSSIYNRVLDLDWIYPAGPSEFCGGDALMRRDILQRVGGYDEALIAGEEPEMCRRMRGMGYQILHIDCPMTGHDLAIGSFQQYWRRAVRAGFAYASVSQRFSGTAEPLWQADARRNLVRGSLLLLSPLVALILAASWGSWAPLLLVFLCLALLVTRTARRAAWKQPGDQLTLFLYAAHSHLQQIPILFGQLKFHMSGHRAHRLIEYKEPTR